MRPELELIEKIEDYLNGRLSAEDRAAFGKQIAADPSLREQVQLQMDIMQGIERASLTQKVKQAGRRFHHGNNFKKWGWAGAIAIIVITVAILFFTNKENKGGMYGESLPRYNEAGEKRWADADRNIQAQIFSIDGSRDTIIETKAGIVLSIPANGFLTGNGQPANGILQLVLKEALDQSSIIQGGLSTQSGDQLLETGGMFFIDARKEGEILKIDPANGIYAGIPADTIKPDMQLFNGKRLPDGRIDWVYPKPIEHDLVPVDIESLDFYPPQYLDSLHRWGYNIKDKKFTDSLYYAFAAAFASTTDSAVGAESKPVAAENDYILVPSDEANQHLDRDSVLPPRYSHPTDICGINPAKIKAIWNNQFQNTFLATREFEERLALIHQTYKPSILDLYVNNLDKNLSSVDSMAAQLCVMFKESRFKEGFLAFAARHDGNVKNASRQFQNLRDYYTDKTRAYTTAIAKTQTEFWNKQAQLDNEFYEKRNQYDDDSTNRVAKNFSDEFELNLKSAYLQLGYDTIYLRRPVPPAMYNVVVTNTGWNNVDRYVLESTMDRKDLNYTDLKSGKTATIKYSHVSFKVNNPEQYDQLYIYLLPDKLNSFMRVNGSDGTYTEKLNELISYKIICIAYKGNQPFFYSKEDIKSATYQIEFKAIDKNELDRQLKRSGTATQARDILKEKDFLRFETKDKERQKNNFSLLDLMRRIEPFILSCYEGSVGPEYSKEWYFEK